MTLNPQSVGTPTLLLQWEEPLWDIRNITRAVEIKCTDTNKEIVEIRNVSDYETILTGLELNKTITCCLVPLTTEGNGSITCDKYSFVKAGVHNNIIIIRHVIPSIESHMLNDIKHACKCM